MIPEADASQALLRQAMAAYARDPARGDFLIQYAGTQAADPLSLYRVAYKFYNRQRRFDLAGEFARKSLEAVAAQAGLPAQAADWTREALDAAGAHLASHALLALKASAFIALRRGDPETASRHLALLEKLDPEDGSGVSVVSALAASLA